MSVEGGLGWLLLFLGACACLIIAWDHISDWLRRRGQ